MRATQVAARLVQSTLLAALLLACFDLAWVYVGAARKARALELLAEPSTAVTAYGVGLWALWLVASFVCAAELLSVVVAGALMRRRPRLTLTTAVSVAAVLVSSPALLGLAVFLSRGGWAKQYLASWPARLLTTAVLAVALGVALETALVLGARLATRRPRAWRAGLGVAALGVAFVDYTLLPGLYLPLHGALLLVAALLLQWLVWESTPPQWRRDGLILAGAAASWLVALPLIAPWSGRSLANFYVAEFAPFAGKALRGVGELRELAQPNRPRTRAASVPAARGAGVDLVGGRDLFILSIDGLSPFRASLPLPGRVGQRNTTPFLAELSTDAVSFARHYTVYPNTEISLLSLLSGVAHDGSRKADDPRSAHARLTRHFAARGYRTYCDIPYAEALFAQLRSPERCDVLVNYAEADWNANGLLAFVEATQAPVFAIVHFVSTHLPYQSFPAHRFGPSREDAYDEALAGTDAVVRRLYTQLLRSRPDARVVVTTDHGHAFGWHGLYGHGSSVHEDQLRIPLLLIGFGLPAQRIDQVTSTLDLFGLLTADAAQRELAQALQAGRAPEPQQQGVLARFQNRRALITERYKLIVDPSAGAEALFDVAADPEERQNLLAREPDRASALRKALDRL